jgi:midasin (ATPase involved in ribosome maturation)
MQQGGLLLIDEISLANDSVLERLNSVFEEGRTLIVTEKSSQEAVKVQAHPEFNMVATMNPSGDFGKKELSPALRNRMTEIWVDSYFQQRSLPELFHKSEIVPMDELDGIDLFLVVSQLAEGLPPQVPLGIFNMIGQVTFVLA